LATGNTFISADLHRLIDAIHHQKNSPAMLFGSPRKILRLSRRVPMLRGSKRLAATVRHCYFRGER